ncbi:MAG TPA: methionine adenosyltransferase, partial [Membranihabitans sp.]|nr:methionine adenosyltransferase [Membranihabitans sp.]
MSYLFSSESVSEGHPDKVSDQISDAILDEFLRQDPDSRVACETLVTTKKAIVAGEVRSNAIVDVEDLVRKTIQKIGYDKTEYEFDADSCEICNLLHAQSDDIARGVDQTNEQGESKTGAGDQGMMFGYAVNETENKMPLGVELSHLLLQELAELRREKKEIPYLRPDAKSQVTIRYSDDHKPEEITHIVLSTQHDDFLEDEWQMQKKISDDIQNILIPRVKAKCPPHIQALFNVNIDYKINPTGNFVIGGPHGDTGLTGRKIIVDTYGGHGAHGGGAFSGKDSSKVDRSAAYACRHIARNLVAAGVA